MWAGPMVLMECQKKNINKSLVGIFPLCPLNTSSMGREFVFCDKAPLSEHGRRNSNTTLQQRKISCVAFVDILYFKLSLLLLSGLEITHTLTKT